MYFFGWKIYTLGMFLGQEICHNIFQVLKKYMYCLGLHISEQNFCCDQWEDEETLIDTPISLAY